MAVKSAARKWEHYNPFRASGGKVISGKNTTSILMFVCLCISEIVPIADPDR